MNLLAFTKIWILLACLPLLAHAAPPVITEMRHEDGKVHITWRHPSNWDFEANWNGGGIQKLHFEGGRNGLRQFKWRVEPKNGTNTFAIRAVDEAGVPQEWAEQSLVVKDASATLEILDSELVNRASPVARERLRWDGVMPPSPMNTAFRVSVPGPRPETVLPSIDLTVTWNYTGPVSPNHEVRVYESVNLRDWRLAATIPTGPVGGFTVEKRPYAFFRVQAFDGLSNQPIDGITNLLMDP